MDSDITIEPSPRGKGRQRIANKQEQINSQDTKVCFSYNFSSINLIE